MLNAARLETGKPFCFFAWKLLETKWHDGALIEKEDLTDWQIVPQAKFARYHAPQV